MVTVASVAVLSLVDMSASGRSTVIRWEETLAAGLVGATLLLALRASGVGRTWQRIADVVVALMVVFLLLLAVLSSLAAGPPPTQATAPVLVVVLSIVAPLVVMRRLLTHRRVTRATLLGAISAYLLIPIAFFYMFLTVNTFEGEPFFGAVQPTTSFMYFSLGGVSTLGVGSLEASTNIGRLLATSEALVGQVYLVVFVALLVGLFAVNRSSSAIDET